MKRIYHLFLIAAFLLSGIQSVSAADSSTGYTLERGSIANKPVREKKRNQEVEKLSKNMSWWPTDAKPGAVKDDERGGYWWYPTTPGKVKPWGNRGYIYVHKIIFDYKSDELPPAKPQELRPSLLLRRVLKDVRVYFDYNKSDLRPDAVRILESGLRSLNKNQKASVLITGHADQRGSVEYNFKLAKARAAAVEMYFIDNGIDPNRIKIVSRGKLDADASVKDLQGLQKDRNAHFMVAEIEEVMLPYQGPPQDVPAVQLNDSTYLTEEKESLESEVQVSTREYMVQSGDTLSKIAAKELGNSNRWMFLYEFNKERISDPHKLKPGQKILIPVE